MPSARSVANEVERRRFWSRDAHRSTGGGTFPGPFIYTDVRRIPSRTVVGGRNDDGLPDVVFTSGNSNGIGVMLNTSH